jgi:hypothetical protein
LRLSAQREKKNRNGTREGPVIKAGWQASTAAAARFSDREGICTGSTNSMPEAASRPRLRAGARDGPPFWLLPDHTALRKARRARRCCCDCRTHTTIVESGGHGSASERTTGLAEIGGKPRRGPYFRCKAQIAPCDLISCLSGTRAC